MEKSGKWLILAILAIALASGAFSWWFRWAATHRAAEFWGPQATTTIRDSQTIEAYRLADTGEGIGTPLTVGGREYPVEKRIDVSKGHGLVHLKQALLEDRSYDWETSFDVDALIPRWALVFHPPPEQLSEIPVTLFLDDACDRGVAIVPGHGTRAFVCPRIATGIEKVLVEWLIAKEADSLNL